MAGVDVADLDRRRWWSQLSWLAQRPVLIPGSVQDNLDLFGALPDQESACRAAGFDEVIAGLRGGLQSVLGRGGTGLSLGQRQRLGLARALGSPAPLLLLDEPTAHLDEQSEARVGLSDWLAGLPEGLDTVLPGGAAAVSAGQRRRLLLARVLISPVPVVLLDEPTEHLDDADSARLLLALLDARGALTAPERTVVVATHQLPDAVDCPRLRIGD